MSRQHAVVGILGALTVGLAIVVFPRWFANSRAVTQNVTSSTADAETELQTGARSKKSAVASRGKDVEGPFGRGRRPTRGKTEKGEEIAEQRTRNQKHMQRTVSNWMLKLGLPRPLWDELSERMWEELEKTFDQYWAMMRANSKERARVLDEIANRLRADGKFKEVITYGPATPSDKLRFRELQREGHRQGGLVHSTVFYDKDLGGRRRQVFVLQPGDSKLLDKLNSERRSIRRAAVEDLARRLANRQR